MSEIEVPQIIAESLKQQVSEWPSREANDACKK